VLGVFLLGSFTRRAGTRSALIGMAFGISAALWVWSSTKVPWPLYAAIGSLTTLAVGSLVSASIGEEPRP